MAARSRNPEASEPEEEEEILSDSELLEKVQQQTFKYFWDFADPHSGMAKPILLATTARQTAAPRTAG
mgnify:CR=1 FL=1